MKALSFGSPPPASDRRSLTGPPLSSPASHRRTYLASIGNKLPELSSPRRGEKQKDSSTTRSARLPRGQDADASVYENIASRATLKQGPGDNDDHEDESMESEIDAVAMDLVKSSSMASLGGQLALGQTMSAQQQQASVKSKARPPSKASRRRKAVLHVEVALLPHLRVPRHDNIKKAVHDFIQANFDSLLPESVVYDWDEVALLAQHVDVIRVAECSRPMEVALLANVNLKIHVYCPSRAFIVDSFSAAAPEDHDSADGQGEDSDVMAATVAQLPSLALEGIWDNLIYEDDVKLRLLNYTNSTQLFGDKAVDFNVISWNRIVLLHGPPGTGKTSLCRALAQKLAIRLSDRYSCGKLVEINSHSIMSKWFSESGKLVQRLFTSVLNLAEDSTCFVVVLIDEVESLTAARAGAMSGKEPSDAVRVVNALLTQLDKLKNKKNVLVMTTSNLSSAIDSAFIDRADIKQYIGLPPVQAVYWILLGCLRELMRSGIIPRSNLLEWKALLMYEQGEHDERRVSRAVRRSQKLLALARICHGMSGRTLRRLPLLAHARYIAGDFESMHSDASKEEDSASEEDSESDTLDEGDYQDDTDEGDAPTIDTWLEAMLSTAKAEKAQMEKVDTQHV